ncbi:putative holin [Halopseudomonas sp.]|uniref:putative holin n=1 Tax=Halopseudomonas sp. TaxID=2901191 RepID=UPI0030036BF4
MPEPTSSTAVAATTAAGVTLAAMVPSIDANAVMGAVLGAALVAYNKSELKAWQRIGSLFFSALVGYLMSSELVTQTPVTETGTGAFIGSIIIVPLGIKLMQQIDKFDIASLIKRGPGG